MIKVAAYCRVSTDEQKADNQLPDIHRLCDFKGWTLAEVYSENASAWQAGHQQEFARLMDDLRSGKKKFEYLVICALDRLCREGIAVMLRRIKSLEDCGCHLVSCQESFLTDASESRELFIAIAAWNANFESKRRSARVRAGLAKGGKTSRRGKDKKPRKRTGYLLRYANKHPPKTEAVSQA